MLLSRHISYNYWLQITITTTPTTAAKKKLNLSAWLCTNIWLCTNDTYNTATNSVYNNMYIHICKCKCMGIYVESKRNICMLCTPIVWAILQYIYLWNYIHMMLLLLLVYLYVELKFYTDNTYLLLLTKKKKKKKKIASSVLFNKKKKS